MENQDYICPQCQCANTQEANFCRACGCPHDAGSQNNCQVGFQPTVCPQCNRAVRASDRFCMNCGHGLKMRVSEEGRFCYRCSRLLPESARYCFGCGLGTATFIPAATPTVSAQ